MTLTQIKWLTVLAVGALSLSAGARLWAADPPAKAGEAAPTGDWKESWAVKDELEGGVSCFTIDAKGEQLAYGSLGGTIKICDGATGKEIKALQAKKPNRKDEVVPITNGGRPLGLAQLAFSPDGHYLASASDGLGGTIELWDVEQGKVARTLQVGRPKESFVGLFAFSPDGKRLAVVPGDPFGAGLGGSSGNIQLWDVASGKMTTKFPITNALGAPQALAFAPDGKSLAFFGPVGSPPPKIPTGLGHLAPIHSVGLLDLSARKVAWKAEAKEGLELEVRELVLSADGKRLALARFPAEGDKVVVDVWSLSENKKLAAVALANPRKETLYDVRLAFHPDNQTLITVEGNGKLTCWDATTGKATKSYDAHTSIKEGVHPFVQLASEGKTLFTAATSLDSADVPQPVLNPFVKPGVAPKPKPDAPVLPEPMAKRALEVKRWKLDETPAGSSSGTKSPSEKP